MAPRELDDKKAARQLPKLKSLLKKYRHLKTMQSSLLQLSELAGTVTDMQAFYPLLNDVIKSLLTTDSFHIVFTDQHAQLRLAYSHNPIERHQLALFDHQHWLNSMTGMVYANNESMHCNAQQIRALIDTGKIVGNNVTCQNWLGVPLNRGHQVIGVLSIQNYHHDKSLGDRDSQLLQFIAEHLVTAIDRVQSRELLEQSIQQRTSKLLKVNEKLQNEIEERQNAVKMHKAMLAISEITATSQNITQFYQALHQEVSTLINANNFYIALYSDDKKVLEFPYYVDEKRVDPQILQLIDGLTELVIKATRATLIANDEITTVLDNGEVSVQPFLLQTLGKIMPKAWLGVPLIVHDEICGVLVIQHYQFSDVYQQSDLELVRFVGQHIATAIERKREQTEREKNKAELEHLVIERTKALQASNLNLRKQIEECSKIEARLYHDAHHDVLTKLPNRAMLTDRLDYAIRQLKRHPNRRFAVLFIDLDRFKIINDTLGHHAGDQFLIEVAARLGKCIRDNDVLARLGGDEFVILIDTLQNQEDVEEIASRIITEIDQPYDFNGTSLYSGASIGIALCGSQYHLASEILRDADAAMYQAKNLGRGRYMFFDVSMREQLIASMTLEQELRIAIKQKQFELHYQKITDLSNTQVIGFEALLRWNHPDKGLLTPSSFLPLAEETGMILEIESWVIEEACRQIKDWQTSTVYCNVIVSINLSGRQLTQVNQLNALISLIQLQQVEPTRLIFEFEEVAFSQFPDLALKGLRKLKEFGVKLALDDYGSGVSSFNFIHSYPFEFIKLDRSFIRAISTNDKNLTLIKALHELGEQFGYRLVAEGIESAEVMKKVQAAGCDFGQGFYINHPEKIIKATDAFDVDDCA